MGTVEHEIHGVAGLLPICQHLRQKFLADTNPGKAISVTYYFGNFFGKPNCPMIAGFVYWVDCAEQYGLPKEDSMLDGNEMASAPSEIIEGSCCKCFDDFLDRHNLTSNFIYPPEDEANVS